MALLTAGRMPTASTQPAASTVTVTLATPLTRPGWAAGTSMSARRGAAPARRTQTAGTLMALTTALAR